MHLLIADDDDYTRLGLIEAIDWKGYGIQEIMQAKDGAEALRVAAWFQPDIVLTDIRMPKLNGIEFAERLARTCGHCKLIFMSGYMEIGYLKSAIKLSAVDYIEKPIKLPELEHAVRKTVDFIREKQAKSVLFDEIMDLQRQKLANMLKQPGAQMEELIQLCKEVEFPADSKYVSMVAWLMPGAEARENSVSAIYEYWKSNGTPSVYCHLDGTKYLFILAIRKQAAGRVSYLTERLLQLNKDYRIGAGKEIGSLSLVTESFQTALATYERSFYHPDLRFIPFVEHKSPQQRLSLGVDLYSEYVHLLKKEPNKLPEWIESLCSNFCEMEYPGKERIVTLFHSFAQAMLREKSTIWTKMNNICIDESDLERHIQECHSMDEVKRFMLQLTEVYLDEAESASRYSRVVRDVIDYIASHCSKADLDIPEIAEHVHFSAAHLGRLFKNETGMTVKQYIGEYRLELAKKLLSDKRYKIHTIAEICGYARASYFIKVFRAAMKDTPVEYRKKSAK